MCQLLRQLVQQYGSLRIGYLEWHQLLYAFETVDKCLSLQHNIDATLPKDHLDVIFHGGRHGGYRNLP